MQRCLVRIFCNERSRSRPLDLELMFGAFLSIWVHLEPFLYCTKLAAKCAKLVQLIQKFRPWCLVKSFATNAPDLHYWTLNSCFGVFLSVRVLFGLFRYCTKFGAKRAKLVQLMQNFMPRYRARIFHSERSRSTPLDPKLMFWCVSFRSGAFWAVSLQHETWCKTRQTGAINVKVRATMSC